MTKDQLKEHIATLNLEGELKQSIIQLIDTAKEVDQKLLDTIADVLDLQAEFYEKTALLLEERAKNIAVGDKVESQTSTNGIGSKPISEPVNDQPVVPSVPIPSENSPAQMPTPIPIPSVPQVPPPGSEPAQSS